MHRDGHHAATTAPPFTPTGAITLQATPARRPLPWLGPLLAAVLTLSCTACHPSLPEPDSPGAQLYASRCGGDCHRAFAPRSLKFQMWKIQVQRKQNILARAGLPPLTAEEMKLMLDYLRRHSG